MKITLVYAGITECGFNSLKGNEGSWMNHGLAILSSVTKQIGYEVSLLDLRRMTGWKDFRKRVSETNSHVFGLTMMSVDYNNVVKAARIIRKACPEATIVVGGPHPSICPEELESLECFDYIFKGEGEISFAKLLTGIERGEMMSRIIHGKRLENLDDAPWADRDIFSSPEEPFVPFLKPPFVTVIAGRGCRYNCNYCQPAERLIFGRNVRRRSIENVIGELKSLQDRFHFNSFMIHDDCLTEDPTWVQQFCTRLKEESFAQSFVAQSRADLICRNSDMIKAMADAGLRLMIIGFESGSDRVLRFLRKGCTRAQNLEAARICRALGIKIWANYMLGLPTETKEEVLETYSMLKAIKPYHCSPAFYTPHPGSDLYELGKKMGIHLITTHDSYRRNTYEPKIKGPDYKFLTDILQKSLLLAEDYYTPPPEEIQTSHSPKQVIHIQRRSLSGHINSKTNYHFTNFYNTLLKIVDKVRFRLQRAGMFAYLDHVAVSSKNMYVSGWVLSKKGQEGIDRVDLYFDDQFVGQAIYGLFRPDVKRVYPSVKDSEDSGFHLLTDVSNFLQQDINKHTILIKAIGVDGQCSTRVKSWIKNGQLNA